MRSLLCAVVDIWGFECVEYIGIQMACSDADDLGLKQH
jgi:hypothetical protein